MIQIRIARRNDHLQGGLCFQGPDYGMVESLKNIFEQVDRGLVTDRYHEGAEKKDHPGPFVIMSYQVIEKYYIQGNPDEWITDPVHHQVEEGIMPSVDSQEDRCIPFI